MTKPAFVILLVGAGELGSRHLQSLACLAGSQIDVIEPSEAACQIAKTRLAQVEVLAKVSFYSSDNTLKLNYDLAIIATSAAIRFEVTKQLLHKTKLDYLILEKVLFQRPEHYHELKHLLEEHQVSAYVNCPRRLFPLYQHLKTLARGGPVSMHVTGNNWGLACNSIHFIDLVSYLTDKKLEAVDSTQLQSCFASKRPGFLEVSGQLTAHFQSGSTLQLQCSADELNPALVTIDLVSAAGHWQIDESKGRVKCRQSGVILLDGLPTLFQSQLTASVVQTLQQQGACSLTPYNESADLHLPLIQSLLLYFNKMHGPMDLCPVT
ncbi:Gfo/Idh/MocA family oxidoreductase [Rheinheimera texasensis]|uniref:Gfo/Idh/MocA family oxidoreductase n=1 Tax=Rheinheimera texasensis TaxID=306205 RepID=UPI0004E147B6|nr:Gfo/Idh/MocA family oxidoreductase [Rheinheimera texasensis]